MEIKQLSEIDPSKANMDYVNLMNTCFNLGLNTNDNLFFKKHIQNPFGQSYGSFVYEDNQLIATTLHLRWEFIWKNKIIKAVQNVDGQVHPNYRGAGVFRKAQEACMSAMPKELVRFGFTNEMAKPTHFRAGWKLSNKYVTKIYPLSWLKFTYQRCLLKRKDFKITSPINLINLSEQKTNLNIFFKSLAATENITNYSYDLLSWKLGLDKNLRVHLFKQDSDITAILIYSIHTVNNYTLMVISDFLHKNIKINFKKLIKQESIDEIQYSANNHAFFDQLFTAIKTTNADMIIHPSYADEHTNLAIEDQVHISRFVTDHF